MKKGLNVMDIRRYHKWLKEEIPLKDIAKKLHTTVDVLERLSPKNFEAGEKKKRAIETATIKHQADTRAKADVLAETAAKLINTPTPNPDIS